jgi:hypothetical protein
MPLVDETTTMRDGEVLAFVREALERPRVSFISHLCGSAGSFFFHTLFDGHPSVNRFMFDLNRAPIVIDDFDARTPEQHVALLLEDNERLFDTASDPSPMNTLRFLGETRDRGIVVDRVLFAHYLKVILNDVPWSLRTLVIALTVAHNLARGIRPRSNVFVFYTHDLAKTVQFVRGFGGGDILALCRHPVNIFESRCRRQFRAHVDLAEAAGSSWRDALNLPLYRPSQIFGLEDFYRLLPSIAGRIGVVSIEELHASPQRSMERVAAYMGIPFSPVLLESTVDGLKWWGSHYTRLHGFSPSLHRDVKSDRVGRGDTAAVMRATLRLQRHLGYTSLTKIPVADALRARLPGRRYFADLEHLRRTTVGRGRGSDARCARFALERAAKYIVARTVHENAALHRLAAHDARADFSKLAVINPVRPGTMHGAW